MTTRHPETPDGRYFVVRGRLWRLADPSLPDDERKSLVSDLMKARRAVRDAKRSGDEDAEAEGHRAVDPRNAHSGSAARSGGATALPT